MLKNTCQAAIEGRTGLFCLQFGKVFSIPVGRKTAGRRKGEGDHIALTAKTQKVTQAGKSLKASSQEPSSSSETPPPKDSTIFSDSTTSWGPTIYTIYLYELMDILHSITTTSNKMCCGFFFPKKKIKIFPKKQSQMELYRSLLDRGFTVHLGCHDQLFFTMPSSLWQIGT